MTIRRFTAAFAFIFTLFTLVAQAHDRRFAYSYETTTMPKGLWEIEPWMTWKHYDDKDRFEFRYELEYGITDRLQLGLYLSDWRYTDFKTGRDKAEWRTAGAEMVYSLSNPTTDWLGAAIYGEVLAGPEKLALEAKLLLQKNFGPVALVYNFVLEAEWEGEDYEEKIGVIENTAGISYQFSPSFMTGIEAVHEVELADWQDAGDHVVYVGPNFSWRTKQLFATVAGLWQTTGVAGEPDSQLRLLLGFSF